MCGGVAACQGLSCGRYRSALPSLSVRAYLSVSLRLRSPSFGRRAHDIGREAFGRACTTLLKSRLKTGVGTCCRWCGNKDCRRSCKGCIAEFPIRKWLQQQRSILCENI